MKRIKFITLVYVSEMKDRTISPIVQLTSVKKFSKIFKNFEMRIGYSYNGNRTANA